MRSAGSVLVVEDNIVNAKFIGFILRDMGFAVTAVTDGKAALDALGTAEFAFVIMDCQMPIMDGLTATVALREMERVSGKHALVFGHSAGVDEETCRRAGMDGFLSKPLKQDEVERTVERWFGKRAA